MSVDITFRPIISVICVIYKSRNCHFVVWSDSGFCKVTASTEWSDTNTETLLRW